MKQNKTSEEEFEDGYVAGALARFWNDETLSFKDFLKQERRLAKTEKKFRLKRKKKISPQ